jgi:hypothetical protein
VNRLAACFIYLLVRFRTNHEQEDIWL